MSRSILLQREEKKEIEIDKAGNKGNIIIS